MFFAKIHESNKKKVVFVSEIYFFKDIIRQRRITSKVFSAK